MRQPVIDLVDFNAGGGHRAAALALQQAIAEQKRPWTVRLVNLTEVLDPQGSFRRVMGFDPEDFYNRRLQRGWTLGLAQELKLLQGTIRLAHVPMRRTLQQHWARVATDRTARVPGDVTRFHLVSVAESDLETLRRGLAELYERLDTTLAGTRDPERVVLVGVMLQVLDRAPSS